jgi:hypothetical protein
MNFFGDHEGHKVFHKDHEEISALCGFSHMVLVVNFWEPQMTESFYKDHEEISALCGFPLVVFVVESWEPLRTQSFSQSTQRI